jgi:putative DNA primase/helicase
MSEQHSPCKPDCTNGSAKDAVVRSETKPQAIPVIPEGIPQALRERPQWVAWRYERRNGKWTKVPTNTRSGVPAEIDNSETWSCFDAVLAYHFSNRETTDGIGFVLSAEDPFCGIDLDDCIDPASGKQKPWAQPLLARMSTYAEISPTRTGVKAFLLGKKPGDRCRKKYAEGEVEIYDQKRFFTVTGQRMPDMPITVEPRQEQLEWLYQLVFEGASGGSEVNAIAGVTGEDTFGVRPPVGLTDDEIIRRASEARNGDKFRRLWNGDILGYSSHSEADLALCSLLAFWTRGDAERIDRLFRQSGLFREKWEDRADYRKETINKAITGCNEIVDSAVNRIVANARKADPPPDASQAGGLVVNGYHLTDLGNAERLAKHHGANLRHCHPWKRWLHWNKQRWEEDQTGALYERAIDTVRRIYAEAAECEDTKMRAALGEHARNSEAAKSIRAMIDLGRALPGIPIMPAEMDTDPWLFNVRKGTLDLRSGKLREHSRSDHITKLCPIEYHPDARCPTWERFLGAIFPDDEDEPDIELITFVQRLLGHCLTGDVSEQNLPIFWGSGANGKSTLVNAVLDTLGSDYSMKANADLLMTSRGERHPTELAGLFGMRLVVASETHQGRHLNETLVKDLTGGEPIRARRMREDFWEFKPTCKIVLLTNHKPRVAGTDEGIWRRLRLVPFTTTFWDPADPGKNPDQLPSHLQQDKQLSQKLAAEREGILAWLVRGCMDWQRDGLTLPAKVRAATTDYRQSEDLVAQWLEECCITGSHDFRCKAAVLFANYRAWCERAGEEEIMNQKSFGDSLSERGFERQKSHGVIWRLGVALSQTCRGDDGDDGDNVSG